MLNEPLFTADTIRLTALDAKEDSTAVAAWTQDSRYIPLSFDAPPRPMSAAQAEKMLGDLLKEANEKQNSFWFAVRTPDESDLLGITGLDWVDWSNGAAHMKLTMKDLAEYERPSAAETVSLMQRYVFHELQMHRLSLAVPAYNESWASTLLNTGFVEEARHREAVFRFGQRWDIVRFGMLAAPWLKGESDE